MPLPLLPLIFGGASALGGLFGNKNRQQQNTESSSQTTTNSNSDSMFERTDVQGFAPEFQDESSALMKQFFGSFGDTELDPEELRKQELVEKNRVNSLASNLFSGLQGGQFSRGMAYSPSGGGFARGMSEMFRGSGLLDVAGNFAKRRFELPGQQEAINSSQRTAMMNMFNLLPRTNTSTGTSSTTGTQTSNTVGNQTANTSGNNGNRWINAIGSGIAGFDAAQQLFNGGNNNRNNAPQLPINRTSQTNAFDLFGQLPQMQQQQPFIRTPNFNPNMPMVQNPFGS